MYNLSDFIPYDFRKYLGEGAVLAWSQKNGYHFLSFIERIHAELAGEQVNIIGVLN